MRILFFAKDAPFVNSGYGKCCREICTRLSRLGHDVAVFATVGNRSASFFEWHGLKIYPGLEDVIGEDIIYDHYKDWKAELLITQMDVWAMKKIHELSRAGLINWLPYVPIDSLLPCPEITERVKNAVHVVTMCKWAKEELESTGISATSIHHGIDTTIFRILPEKKEKLKQELGFPSNCFLIGMVQANQFTRKAIEEQLRGIAIFKEKHPQIDIRLYFHTQPNRVDSFHLPSLVQILGLKELVKFPNDYFSIKGFTEEHMARIYNAFDVLLSATNGEGFGLPVIESQGCGVPVVATDCMSFPELILAGALCKVKTWFTTPTLQLKAIPDDLDIGDKLWLIYNTEYNRKEIQDLAHYLWSWDSRIIQEWMCILDTIREKLKKQCLQIPNQPKAIKEMAKKICEY